MRCLIIARRHIMKFRALILALAITLFSTPMAFANSDLPLNSTTQPPKIL